MVIIFFRAKIVNWDRFADTPPAPCHRFEVNPKSLHPFSFDFLKSTPNHFKSLLDKPSQRQPKNKGKSSPNPPMCSKNPPQSFPKSTQNRFRSPLETHLGPMSEKNWILNVQKVSPLTGSAEESDSIPLSAPPFLPLFFLSFFLFPFFYWSSLSFSSLFPLFFLNFSFFFSYRFLVLILNRFLDDFLLIFQSSKP